MDPADDGAPTQEREPVTPAPIEPHLSLEQFCAAATLRTPVRAALIVFAAQYGLSVTGHYAAGTWHTCLNAMLHAPISG